MEEVLRAARSVLLHGDYGLAPAWIDGAGVPGLLGEEVLVCNEKRVADRGGDCAAGPAFADDERCA